jgi:hypothetical protein
MMTLLTAATSISDIIQAWLLLVSALALLVSVLALALQISSRQRAVTGYRIQRNFDTRADAAGKALFEVYKLTDFLACMAAERSGETAAKAEERWQPVTELKQSFQIARQHVDAHLGKHQRDAMIDILIMCSTLHHGQVVYDFRARYQPEHERVRDRLYGETAERVVQQLRERADDVLKPPAQHREYKGPGWIARWRERRRQTRSRPRLTAARARSSGQRHPAQSTRCADHRPRWQSQHAGRTNALEPSEPSAQRQSAVLVTYEPQWFHDQPAATRTTHCHPEAVKLADTGGQQGVAIASGRAGHGLRMVAAAARVRLSLQA